MRLVSLLGDLDLEVEFCSPRKPLPLLPRLSPSSSPPLPFQETADGKGSPYDNDDDYGENHGDDGGEGRAATSSQVAPQASAGMVLSRLPGSSLLARALPAETVGREKSYHASVVEEGRTTFGCWGGGVAPPLPAPARAKKSSDCDGGASMVPGVERSWRGAGKREP